MECIDTGWISSEGKFVTAFESGMAEYVGRKYGIAVCNGTAALETAVQALQLERGTEVILPAFTIMSCAQAIVKCGLIPVTVDCEADTWNMDVRQIESRISSRTSAIMIVHIYGLTVDVDPILALARKYGLKVIEDAAQAHGQAYCGKKCGSFGDVSTFSFYPNKHITCGEGGMVLTDDEQIAKRCREIRNLCFNEERRFVHYEIGSNFRMSNLQAAVGVAQLEKIERTIERKKWIGQFYREAFADLKTAETPVWKTDYCENIYWVFGLVLKPESGKDAAEVMRELKGSGIGTRPFFYPINRQPVLQQMGLCRDDHAPNAAYIADYGFYIPSGLGIKEEQMERVVEAVYSVLG